MNFLGSLGQLYMFVLLILLFLGSGFSLWGFINYIHSRNEKKPEAINKKSAAPQKNVSNENITEKKIGGFNMNNNGWLKLAVFSFVGILVSVILLGFISTANPSSANLHQQHQQQGNTNLQSGMNTQTGDMQSGMNTQMGNMQNGMNTQMGNMQNNYPQQQLNQIQQQINQLQQQLNNNGMQMQQSGMGNMGGSGNMGGMGGMGGMSGSGGGMGGMSGGMMGGMGGMSGSGGGMGGMSGSGGGGGMGNMQQSSGGGMSSMPMM